MSNADRKPSGLSGGYLGAAAAAIRLTGANFHEHGGSIPNTKLTLADDSTGSQARLALRFSEDPAATIDR
jgi:hypothetical protein